MCLLPSVLYYKMKGLSTIQNVSIPVTEQVNYNEYHESSQNLFLGYLQMTYLFV